MNELREEIELPELDLVIGDYDDADRIAKVAGGCIWGDKFQRANAINIANNEAARANCRERQLKSSLAANREQKAEIERLERRYLEEVAIVGRVWKALGISTYEQAGGKAIDEIVASLRASVGERWIDVKQELPPFGERVLAYSPANEHQGSRYFVTSLHVYSGKKDMIWLDEDINEWATHWKRIVAPTLPGEEK